MADGQARKRAIAIDLGGTRFRVALATEDGEMQWRSSGFTHVEQGVQAVLQRIYATVDEAFATINDRESVKGIGIAAPGPLDPETGVIHDPPNMPGWDAVPLRQLFEVRYSIPVQVGNDANLAAVGEHRYGAGKGFHHLVYMTVSTGIGGGVIINDRLLLGAEGFAGEVGHMTIDMQGERCPCGNVGCLEWLASGTSIARRAREMVQAGIETWLANQVESGVTAHQVVELAYQGDDAARQLLRDAGVAIGVGIVNLAHLFNPQRMILGGGISLNAGPIWWEVIQETVRSRVMPSIRQGLEVVPAALGDDAGLLGGVALAIHGPEPAGPARAAA